MLLIITVADNRISSVLAPRLEKSTSAKVDSMLSTITTATMIEYIPMVTLTTDIYKVFYERYRAEHPDWDESREGMQAYTDALAYYLRDEIGMETVPDTLPEKPVINEEYAVKALKDQMTDYWSWQWDAEAVEAMVPQVEWDETYRMWPSPWIHR